MITLRRTGGAALLLAASMALAGCAGATQEEQIAAQVCDLYAELVDGDADVVFDTDLVDRFDELERQASEVEMTDADVEAAVREECPDTLAELEELFGEGF